MVEVGNIKNHAVVINSVGIASDLSSTRLAEDVTDAEQSRNIAVEVAIANSNRCINGGISETPGYSRAMLKGTIHKWKSKYQSHSLSVCMNC